MSVRRKNDASDIANTRTLGFNEYRVLGTYREPRTIGVGWDVLMSGYTEQAIRPGFDLFSRGMTAQLTRQGASSTSNTVGYRLGKNDTNIRQLDRADEDIVDRLFPEVRLSSFTASRLRDTRDDPFDPTRGTITSFETELAGRAIGSERGFSRSFASGTIYRRMPGTDRIVMAAGARLGMAWGFPQTTRVSPASRDSGAPESIDVLLSDPALPISERFFAGGDTTVRGFALDRLGDPRGKTGGTIDQDGFPRGGNAMVVFNTELRIRVTQVLGVVTFLDAGNVYDRVQHMSLGRIRAGSGFGIRYSSPVGPIRVDLGFKIGERYFFCCDENTLPTQEPLAALHISIGQAF